MGLALHNSPVDLAFTTKHFPVPSPRLSVIRKPRTAHPKAVARALLDRGFTPEDLPAFIRDPQTHEPRRREHRARRHGTTNDTDDDGVRLARSSVPLPSDNSRNRVPSLERQNAFWDPRTTKRPVTLSDDAEVAELYRLGLLYDDDHARGSGFVLDAIVREAPAYSITTRARKRTRRGSKASSIGLQMDWDFTGLEEDDEVARYLLSASREMAKTAEGRRLGYRTVWRSLPAVDEPVDEEQAPQADDTPELIPDDANECDKGLIDDDNNNDDEDEMDWAVLHRERDADDTATTEDAATGVWIVLGDGS
ncbi:hypothetical protein ACHAQA_001524 [Verticillium albo-atrum]